MRCGFERPRTMDGTATGYPMPTMIHPGGGKVGHRVRKEAMPSRLTTTLYELIVALQSAAGPNDDALVVATIVHLLRSGRLTFLGKTANVCSKGTPRKE
jgi:hypothetical protein